MYVNSPLDKTLKDCEIAGLYESKLAALDNTNGAAASPVPRGVLGVLKTHSNAK